MSVYYREGVGWYIDLQVNGVRIARRAGATEAEALLAQNKLRQDAKASSGGRKRNILFDKAAQDYLTHVKATLSAKSYALASLVYTKHLKPYFQGTYLHEIDNPLLLAFQRHEKKKVWQGRKTSNRSVNIHMSLVRQIIRHTVEIQKLPEPQLHYPILREATKTHAVLEPEEFKALTENVSSDLPLKRILFGRYTGLRPQELAYLAWDDINLEGRYLTVKSKPDMGFVVKADKQRVIPLSAEAITLLQSLRHTSKWVFSHSGKPVLSFKKSLSTAAHKAGIKRHVTPNMLRHTFASQLLRAGADVYTVAQLMGHSNIKTTQKYLHTTTDTMRNAVELLSLHKEG